MLAFVAFVGFDDRVAGMGGVVGAANP